MWLRVVALAWVAVASPHFVVTSNDGAESARHVAGQLEKLRALYKELFPQAEATDPPLPLQVLALRDRGDFRALLPTAYGAKGAIDLTGFYYPGEDVNRILLRLDVNDEQFPYATIFHEYTHQMTQSEQAWMPVWLNEGLAEYYETAQFTGKDDVTLGRVEPGRLEELQHGQFIPLAQLLAVDHNSPYYHEQEKGSLFYAESWALTHMLLSQDYSNKTHRLQDYTRTLASGQGSAAAVMALGGEEAVQKALEAYVRQTRFLGLSLKLTTPIEEQRFTATAVSEPQAEAVKAGFLMGAQRYDAARQMANQALQQEAGNATAIEALGAVALRQQDYKAARDWYGKAAQADPKNYFALYAFADASLRLGGDSAAAEAALRSAIALNPQYGPAYDRLARVETDGDRQFDAAYRDELHAIALQPGNVYYRMDAARILLVQQRADDASTALTLAANLAKTPQEQAEVKQMQAEVEQYRTSLAKYHEMAGAQAASRVKPGVAAAPAVTEGPPLLEHAPSPDLPQAATGKIALIHCSPTSPALDLTLDTGDEKVALHADSMNTVDIEMVSVSDSGANTAPGPTCQGWAGLEAQVSYKAAATKGQAGTLLKLELRP